MRRLIESGATRGDRFLQIGLRGYWPEPETLAWMAEQQMRSYEMTEVVGRGLDEVLTEAFAIATDECDAGSSRSTSTSSTPGSRRAPGPPSRVGSPRASCSTPSAGSAMELLSPGWTSSRCRPPTTTPGSRPFWRPRGARGTLGHRLAEAHGAGEAIRQPGDPLLGGRDADLSSGHGGEDALEHGHVGVGVQDGEAGGGGALPGGRGHEAALAASRSWTRRCSPRGTSRVAGRPRSRAPAAGPARGRGRSRCTRRTQQPW